MPMPTHPATSYEIADLKHRIQHHLAFTPRGTPIELDARLVLVLLQAVEYTHRPVCMDSIAP